ncbi:MAG: hypothetical protein WCU88_10230 [Elusimicrobiota bacterium]|jgi:hypothetical protein
MTPRRSVRKSISKSKSADFAHVAKSFSEGAEAAETFEYEREDVVRLRTHLDRYRAWALRMLGV